MVSLVFSFDPNLIDSQASDSFGEYTPTLGYEVQLGDLSYAGSSGTITISDSLATGDSFRFSGALVGPSLTSSVGIAPYDRPEVNLLFRDSSGLLFDDDSLPSSQIDLTGLSIASLTIGFSSDEGASGGVGSDLLAASVPEPSSGVLLILGVTLPAVFRRQRG